jgi:NADH-ubiquinone oxidoreductase chain 5
MEGPTPVSALIHAATMVTAGVFLLIRCSHLFELLPLVTDCVLYVGGFTAFFAGTIGLFQSDLKKVIAYSTCSQLGYMVLCCGLSFYNLSLFHLFNHAFFKALLFLSAGSVIHALNDEQDFRKLGGLFRFLPVTYLTFFIGTLSLLGFPFLTGYYSKDLIFEYCLFQVYSLEVGFSVLDQTWRNLYLTTSTLSVAFYFFYLIFFSKNFALLSVFGVIILTAMYS